MSGKRIILLTSAAIFILIAIITLWASSAPPGMAQCGDTIDKSSCITCHEATYPVEGTGEWHDIHARKDCCWNCHGGNTAAQEKDLAHEGMMLNPLYDTYQDCYACHPDDYQGLAERFGASLGIVPVNNVPDQPTPQPISAQTEKLLVILPTPEPSQVAPNYWYPEVILMAGALLTLVLLVIFSRSQANDSNTL